MIDFPGAVGAIFALCALGTWGAGHFHFVEMTGLLPPHYGYTAFVLSALVFVTRAEPCRALMLYELLLSFNRCSWVGIGAGLAYRHRKMGFLVGVLAVSLGLVIFKPVKTNDITRVQIWTVATRFALAHPEGVGRNTFHIQVGERPTTAAHSDLLQFLLENGVRRLVAMSIILGLCLRPLWNGERTREKSAMVSMLAQSALDNRLHHPVLLFLFIAFLVKINLAPNAQ